VNARVNSSTLLSVRLPLIRISIITFAKINVCLENLQPKWLK
jgi:hypothetical protein